MNSNTNDASLAKRFRCGLESALARLAATFVPMLPYQVMRQMAYGLGWCAYFLDGRSRRISLANLDLAFGDSKSPRDKARIARHSMQNFAATLLTLFWSSRLTNPQLAALVEVDTDGLRHLRQRLAAGRGAVVVTPHYGNWELLLLHGAASGLPLRVITEARRNQAVEALITCLRSRSGARIIPQRGAALKLLKALRRGECVILITDHNPPEEGGGEWLEFFGVPAFSNNIAAALALRTGAPLFACHSLPLPDGRVRLIYGPEIPYTITGDDHADIRRISQQCLDHFEKIIRENPDHWLWFYKRWKHRKDITPARYPFYTSTEPLSLPSRRSNPINTPQSTSVPPSNAPNV